MLYSFDFKRLRGVSVAEVSTSRSTGSGAEQESLFLFETGAEAEVTSHVKFFKSKAGVYQEFESINFSKPEFFNQK